MKKLLIGFSILLISLLVIGCSDDLDIIQDGTMGFNKTATIGKVLDNWSYCEDGKWRMFESKNGVRVVEFACNRKIEDRLILLRQELNKMQRKAGKGKEFSKMLDIEHVKYKFQFTINQDDSFQISSMERRILWEDGTQYRNTLNAIKTLKIAYADGNMMDLFNLGLKGSLIQIASLYGQGEKELGVL